jgi:hypothetical protein
MNRPRPLTVTLDESEDEIAATHRTVLAGLPDRWRISHAAADAAVVFGGHIDWPLRAEAALAAGVRGVLVTCPVWTSPTAVAELAAVAAATGVPITVESAYLADPSWKQLLPTLREHAAEAVLVDSLRITPWSASRLRHRQGLSAHCLEHLAVLQTVIGPLHAVAFYQRATEHYALGAESAGRVLNVVGVRGGAGSDQLTVDLVGLARRWRISFDSGAIARPTTVEMMDASGVYTAPAIYETGQRGAWLELHEAMTDAVPVSYDLALLGHCLRLTAESAAQLARTSVPGIVA